MYPLVVLGLLLAGGAFGRLPAEELVSGVHTVVSDSQTADGRLDWGRHRLTAYGEGVAPADITDPAQRRLMGFRAAQTVAYRNLLELAGAIIVDGQTTVDKAMVSSDSVRARVQGLVRGARVVPGSQKEADGVYRVALELDLLPALADAVLPPHGTPSRPAPPVDAPAHPYIPSKPHTGLLVDARGLGLAPGLAPRILDDEGTLVYSASGVDRQYAARIGVVGYDRDLERARHSERLGGASARPLELKAKEVAGANRADVVLTREDGIRARMADMEGHFLSECRVVFVVGPAATEGK